MIWLQSIGINLGVFLLYMPPLMLFITRDFLANFRHLFKYHYVLFASFLGYAFMMSIFYPYVQAWIAFTFYFVAFNLMFFWFDRYTLDRILAFELSVYACFAISVLWEWPYQLSYVQNMDAVIMSSFKALGLPFFLFRIYHLGWRPSLFQLSTVIMIMGYGLLALVFIEQLGLMLHIYRLPWLILFLFLLPFDKLLNRTHYIK